MCFLHESGKYTKVAFNQRMQNELAWMGRQVWGPHQVTLTSYPLDDLE